MKRFALLVVVIAILVSSVFGYAGARVALESSTDRDPAISLSVFGEENTYGAAGSCIGEGVAIYLFQDNYVLFSLYPFMPHDEDTAPSILGIRVAERHGAGYVTHYERPCVVIGGTLGLYWKWVELFAEYTALSYVHYGYQRTLSQLYFGIAFEGKIFP